MTTEYQLDTAPRQLRELLTLVRSPHDAENPFFMMRRSTARDASLSYEARGLLAYLLSLKDGWELKPESLIIPGKCGRKMVYELLKELELACHLKRPQKYQDAKGKWRWRGNYEVYEQPYSTIGNTDIGSEPYTENRNTVFGHTKDQYTVKEDTEEENKRITASEKNDADALDTPPEHSDSKTAAASDTTPSKQKEKAAEGGTQQTDNLTNVPPKSSDELQTEKPVQRQRNPMFDAVCEHIFGISSPEELKVLNETEGAGSRIMTVALWLNGKIDKYKKGGNPKTKPTIVGFITQPAEIEHTKLFAKDWKKARPNSDVPRDLETFALRWREWVSKKGSALNASVNGAAPKRRGYDAKRILALVEKEGISGDEAFKRLYPNG